MEWMYYSWFNHSVAYVDLGQFQYFPLLELVSSAKIPKSGITVLKRKSVCSFVRQTNSFYKSFNNFHFHWKSVRVSISPQSPQHCMLLCFLIFGQSDRRQMVSQCSFGELFFLDGTLLCCPGWRAVAQPLLTVTSTSQVQAMLLPQSPE